MVEKSFGVETNDVKKKKIELPPQQNIDKDKDCCLKNITLDDGPEEDDY